MSCRKAGRSQARPGIQLHELCKAEQPKLADVLGVHKREGRYVIVVQSFSPAWLFVTPWTGACQASQDRTLHRQQSSGKKAHVFPFCIMQSFILALCCRSVVSDSLRPHRLQYARLPCPSPSPGVCSNTSIEMVMPLNRLILCCPLLLPPSIFPSIRVFSSESALRIRWPKYWSFSFSISPSNEYSGLISFRIDWFDLLAVQGTLKSLLQHHSSKSSILQCSAFFMVQLPHSHTWLLEKP